MAAENVTEPTRGAGAGARLRDAAASAWSWRRILPMLLIVLVALLGPWFVPYDPEKVVGDSSTPPGSEFWFGTDSAGLDVFSRTVVATRINVFIAAVVTVLATLIGSVVGITIGMNESRRGPLGWLARGAARVVDLTDAVPAVLVGLVVISFFGATLPTLIVGLSVILSPIQIRLVRTEVLRVRAEAYLDAARVAGSSEARLIVRHVLPNSVGPAWENSSVIFAVTIIVTAALGFVGVGLPPPTPEWGSMLARGAGDAAVGRWWGATFPAVALALTVACFALGAAEVMRRRAR